MKTIIEIAQSVGAVDQDLLDRHTEYVVFTNSQLEAFAELVRADERNSWPAEMEAMERQVNILTDALAQEREACAKVCEEVGEESDSFTRDILRSTAAAIRARGSRT